MNQNFRVMKKLKLVGVPYKIHKNTAFISKMFNSALEVAKYEGAKLQTVSGIRGQIKKAVAAQGVGAPDGCYRATFEDKLKKSDIVFCKAWFQVDIPKFYNPVYSYGDTRLLKITSEIRRDQDIDLKFPKDSQYIMQDEEQKLKQLRDERVSLPLNVPRHIASNLPFKAKAKINKINDKEDVEKRTRTNLLHKLNLPSKRPFKTQFMNESDKKIYSLVQRLGTIDKVKYQENKKRVDKLEAKKKETIEEWQEIARKKRNKEKYEKTKTRRK
jgi:ribosome biogenesis protein BMS1